MILNVKKNRETVTICFSWLFMKRKKILLLVWNVTAYSPSKILKNRLFSLLCIYIYKSSKYFLQFLWKKKEKGNLQRLKFKFLYSFNNRNNELLEALLPKGKYSLWLQTNFLFSSLLSFSTTKTALIKISTNFSYRKNIIGKSKGRKIFMRSEN